MGKSIFILICSALLFAGATLLTGCSLFALTYSDKGEPGNTVTLPDGLAAVPLETILFVVKKDSTLVQGHFKGATPGPDTIPYTNYQDEFERWRTQPGHVSFHMPPFGSVVQVLMKPPHETDIVVGRFAGFDITDLRLSTDTDAEIRKFPIDSIKEIRRSLADSTTHNRILEAFADGVPLASGRLHYRTATGILLDPELKVGNADARVIEIPLVEVQAVHLWQHTDTYWIGLGAGVALDLLAVATAFAIGSRFQ